jgi:hypothetical protein
MIANYYGSVAELLTLPASVQHDVLQEPGPNAEALLGMQKTCPDGNRKSTTLQCVLHPQQVIDVLYTAPYSSKLL